jgi:hypothetical protein
MKTNQESLEFLAKMKKMKEDKAPIIIDGVEFHVAGGSHYDSKGLELVLVCDIEPEAPTEGF